MSSSVAHADHHHEETFLSKYVFSMDHKMISKQFLITGIIMGLIGMAMSIAFRLQLAYPDTSFPILEWFFGSKWAPDGKLDAGYYMALVTMHGTIMVFYVLTAGLSGTFANLLLPLQIGARDMASPFMNMLSYWFFLLSSIVLLSSLFVETGPASGGWTIYPPLSALPKAMPGSGMGMTLWLTAIVLFIVSSLLGGINYISTVLNMRTKGMSMTRLPLTVWALFLTAVLGLLSFPVLLGGGLLLLFDRGFGTSFYLSDIYLGSAGALEHTGGSPILFQHLFWFLGHPEVYIIIMPALGITSEIIAVNSRKPIFGYTAMVISLMGIAFLSFIVWGHHMFITGMNPLLGAVFLVTTLIIAVPSAVKTFNYLATLWRGNIRFTNAMMFAIGLVSFFISGGLTGIFLGNATLDIQLHDTYFVVGHFHIVMGCAAIFGMLAGIYHWFPKMFGRLMNKPLGYIHFWFTFISAYLVFFPMHFMGLAGVPRRYYAFTLLPEYGVWFDVNVVMTLAAILGGIAQIVFLYNFFSSIFIGKKSGTNPWQANTLEWTTPEERIHGNWPGEIPTVYRWAYDYSNPAYDEDFMMQNVPDEGVEEELFETSKTKVNKSAKKPKPEAVTLFTLIKNWLKPNTI
ncbi:cbb3-type cytochrome c oxidase subunit I [Bacteroidia bacterium]|jgi:cytochrome c oxidase subunit 1|nr:cbb3-type cytochrome c oxidase subunit I [Bacteroidia bacterium]MDC0467797.1 cbb3-type cytochrome c oxidase subunit I [Bacteroidia bacterium]MDC0561187.1 cbb3-type cytochrome c oxidase subunit I [Bacteroidia bacterium]MDC3407097.1 cbb3-type cytochrome c oxidase subunit I [Bacteroidia bacterium]